MKSLFIFVAITLLSSIAFATQSTPSFMLGDTEVRLVYEKKEVTTSKERKHTATRWTYTEAKLELLSGTADENIGKTLMIRTDPNPYQTLDFICLTVSNGKLNQFMGRDYSGYEHVDDHGFWGIGGPEQSIALNYDRESETPSLIIVDYDPDFQDPEYWKNFVCSNTTLPR